MSAVSTPTTIRLLGAVDIVSGAVLLAAAA